MERPVSFGGPTVALLVGVKDTAPGLFGISLPAWCSSPASRSRCSRSRPGSSSHGARHGRSAPRRREPLLDEALERQRVIEAELRASEERFRTIVCGTRPTSSCCSTSTTAPARCSNRADFFGHPLEVVAEPGGLSRSSSTTTEPTPTRSGPASASSSTEQVCEATLRVRRTRTGDVRHARLRFSPLDDGDASVAGTRLFGAISDVTDPSNNEHPRGRAPGGAAPARSGSKRSGSSRAASRTTSTTCSRPSSRRPSC